MAAADHHPTFPAHTGAAGAWLWLGIVIAVAGVVGASIWAAATGAHIG